MYVARNIRYVGSMDLVHSSVVGRQFRYVGKLYIMLIDGKLAGIEMARAYFLAVNFPVMTSHC